MNACEMWFKKHSDVGPFLLRVMVGIIFVVAGYGKITSTSMVAGFLESMGFPIAIVFAWLLALGELLGGLALIAGYWTKYATKVLAIIMIVAILTAHWSEFFKGWTYPLTLLFANISLMFSGPGAWALGK